MLEVKYLTKFVEEDKYNEGCIPETARLHEVDVNFSDETQEGLIEKICDFLGIENNKENYQIDPCEDDEGRIDFSLMEDEASTVPSARQMERWKTGELKLWAVTYTAQVESVQRSKAKLTK